MSRTIAWQYALRLEYKIGDGKDLPGVMKKFNYYEDNKVVNLTSDFTGLS